MSVCTLEELHAATAIVRRYFEPTPTYTWPMLNGAIGTDVWVKHENATPTGAFKVRGGLVYVDNLIRNLTSLQTVSWSPQSGFMPSAFAVASSISRKFFGRRLWSRMML